MASGTALHAASVGLVVAGTAVIVTASVGAAVARDTFQRLHLVTPITSVGGPLLGVGFAVRNGWGLTTASILLPTFMLFFAGPVLSTAIARVTAQLQGRIEGEGPD
ncbi:MAG TPA: monovalent cation/H(+) antiporter subunit G [Acidimicrobiales bacterium]|nr:monovalent cation/H(+) antiporter subunit G [Acidimicrobiales bacterium]